MIYGHLDLCAQMTPENSTYLVVLVAAVSHQTRCGEYVEDMKTTLVQAVVAVRGIALQKGALAVDELETAVVGYATRICLVGALKQRMDEGPQEKDDPLVLTHEGLKAFRLQVGSYWEYRSRASKVLKQTTAGKTQTRDA